MRAAITLLVAVSSVGTLAGQATSDTARYVILTSDRPAHRTPRPRTVIHAPRRRDRTGDSYDGIAELSWPISKLAYKPQSATPTELCLNFSDRVQQSVRVAHSCGRLQAQLNWSPSMASVHDLTSATLQISPLVATK